MCIHIQLYSTLEAQTLTFVVFFVHCVVGRHFSFQPVPHNWFNKGCAMSYSVCGIVHIKNPLLLVAKGVALVVAAGFISHYRNGP